MSKYEALIDFLKNLQVNTYRMKFEDIEKIIGEKLPPSAYQHAAWWANDPSHIPMKYILDAGWKTTKVDFNTREIRLERIDITAFQKLKNYILNEMQPQANYQPVMIMTLIKMGGSLTKDTLAAEIKSHNPDNPDQDYKQIPVYEVLTKKGIVKQEGNHYVLNGYYDFTPEQKQEIVELCEQKIQELKQSKEKIAICWPTDADDEKIEAFIDVIKQKGKALWGVNWTASRIQRNDFPIKGYLYYRRKIIAIANIIDITDANSTSNDEITLKPANIDYANNRYSTYLHLDDLHRCEPFPHTVLQLMDPQREMPDVVQQRVYVKELTKSSPKFNVWIWSVTAENWEIVKEEKIWASRIRENIRIRVRPGDKVIFYVQGTGQFQGIFEFDGEWYDAKDTVWTDETNSIIYPSQIRLKPIKLGYVNVYDIAPKLKIFPNPNDKRIVNLVLKGGAGYPSNNGKPIPYEDYLAILNSMSTETQNYLLLRHSTVEEHKWRDELGKKYHFGKIANYTKLKKGTRTIWFDRKEGRYYFWGYGDVDNIIEDVNGEFLAVFKNFVPFIPQKESTEILQEKIAKSPGYNIQSSILEIDKEIYDEIVGNKVLMVFDDEPLPDLTNEDITYGYEKLSDELLIPKEKVIEIVTALASGRHVLLAGPIGTGKTQLAKLIPEIFWEKVGGYYSEDHTATADWSTHDVIGGIFPKMDDNKPIYEIQHGCVVETVRKNWQYDVDGGSRIFTKMPDRNMPYRGTWLILDEFNRADIDKAFGQLFTSLRTKMLKIPSNKKDESFKELKIPEDYRIIGTLNTADKHYLFQLSDALKSRFAYIEIDIPSPAEHEKETYYAMRNAIYDLKKNYDSLVVLDNQNKIINKEQSNPEFIKRVYQAYHFLDLVRIFKKLGTAILKLIYQNMLTGTIMGVDPKIVLDNALTSNLIPQLENLPQASIGAILALYYGDIVKYFKDAYKSPNRQSYVDAFSKIVNYLQLQSANRLILEFTNGTLQVDNDSTWQPIQVAHDNKKKEFETELNQLKQSMEDLVKAMVV